MVINYIKYNTIFIASLFSGICSLSAKNVHIGPGRDFPNIGAACPSLKPGDTVYVHAGTYETFQYYSGLKGTSDQWITIIKAPNEDVIINGGWQFTSSEYIRIEKLIFKTNSKYNNTLLHFDHAGDCNKLSHHIAVDSCSFIDVADGNSFKFGGVSDFEVSHCRFINNTSDAAGIALNESRNGIIRNCYFENIKTKGIQFKLGTFNVKVYTNYFKNTGIDDSTFKVGESGGAQYYCPDAKDWHAKDIKIYSNIIAGGKTPFSIGLAINTEITNNTIVSPATFVMRLLSDETTFENKNNKLVNNIFYLDKTIYFNGTSSANNINFQSIVFQNNLFYAAHKPNWTGPDPYTGEYDAEEIKGVKFINNIIANPMFNNPANTDYSLGANSPALGTGLAVPEPALDYFGKPFKALRAIGAIESDAVISDTSEPTMSFQLACYPNPTNSKLYLIVQENYDFEVEIINAYGKCIAKSKNANPISVEELSNGVYWMRLTQGSWVSVGKFIKN